MRLVVRRLMLVVVTCLGFIGTASPSPISFTDWTSFTASSSEAAGNGTAAGTLTIGSMVVGVSYSGDVRDGTGVTTTIDGTSGVFNSSVFAPVLATSDVIANDSGVSADRQNLHTITFDTALLDPILHVFSLGDGNTQIDWDFVQAFSILSRNSAFDKRAGEILRGRDGSGTIQFSGPISQISWTSSRVESTTGFQVGASAVANVSEPTTTALLALGLLGAGFARKRRTH